MKITISTILVAAPLALFAACTSPQASRSAELPGLLAALPVETQDKILQGVVEKGYTADMVYVAVGKPEQIGAGTTDGRQIEVWTYSRFVYQPYRPMVGSANAPKRNHAPGIKMSQSLSQWDTTALPSGLSAHGDVIDTPRNPAEAAPTTGSTTICTLKVLLYEGRVIAVRYEL